MQFEVKNTPKGSKYVKKVQNLNMSQRFPNHFSIIILAKMEASSPLRQQKIEARSRSTPWTIMGLWSRFQAHMIFCRRLRGGARLVQHGSSPVTVPLDTSLQNMLAASHRIASHRLLPSPGHPPGSRHVSWTRCPKSLAVETSGATRLPSSCTRSALDMC